MKFIYWVAALFAVIILVVIITSNSDSPSEYDGLARCLTEKGFKFYGAYWCSHCQAQKELFGSSASQLPYIECSLPNNAGQTQLCSQAGIISYPTWELPSGKRIEGELSIQELVTFSGCSINKTI
jgi:hypothetical protein